MHSLKSAGRYSFQKKVIINHLQAGFTKLAVACLTQLCSSAPSNAVVNKYRGRYYVVTIGYRPTLFYSEVLEALQYPSVDGPIYEYKGCNITSHAIVKLHPPLPSWKKPKKEVPSRHCWTWMLQLAEPVGPSLGQWHRHYEIVGGRNTSSAEPQLLLRFCKIIKSWIRPIFLQIFESKYLSWSSFNKSP